MTHEVMQMCHFRYLFDMLPVLTNKKVNYVY